MINACRAFLKPFCARHWKSAKATKKSIHSQRVIVLLRKQRGWTFAELYIKSQSHSLFVSGLVIVSLEGADHVDRLGVQHVGQGVAAQPLFYFIDTRQYLSCSYHLAACTRFIVNSSLSLSINLCTATKWKILQFVLPSWNPTNLKLGRVWNNINKSSTYTRWSRQTFGNSASTTHSHLKNIGTLLR